VPSALYVVRCSSCVTPMHTYIHSPFAAFKDLGNIFGRPSFLWIMFFYSHTNLAPQELGLFCISLVLGLFTTFKPATQMYLHIEFLPHSKHTVLADQLSVLYVLRTIPNAQYIASAMDSVRYFQYRWYIYLPLSFRGLIVVFTWP
jgi:ABC-type glycerol-3-phosphate transport system permease component